MSLCSSIRGEVKISQLLHQKLVRHHMMHYQMGMSDDDENGKILAQVNEMLHALFRFYQRKLNPAVRQTSRSR